jgi:hypothetical protein
VSVLPTSVAATAPMLLRACVARHGQRLRGVEAHAVVDGGEQRVQALVPFCSSCWISTRVS